MKGISTVIILILVCVLGYILWSEKKLYEEFLRTDPVLVELVEEFKEFFKREREMGFLWEEPIGMLNEEIDFMDSIEIYRSDESYTMNKEKVYLCMKDENGEYYDKNILKYVLAHELGHVLCDENHHTPKFYRIFDQLLERMKMRGFYDERVEVPRNYCEEGDPEI